jgi:hypothetical protein
MTTTEQRELGAWIEKEIYGGVYRRYGNGCGEWKFPDGTARHYTRQFTTDPATSDALDDKILEKCKGYLTCLMDDGKFLMRDDKCGVYAIHHDKKICRALFAKKLFGKE